MASTPKAARRSDTRRGRADTSRAHATYRFGFWIALVTAVLTVITFALALTAIPNDVPYPFTREELGYLLMSLVFLFLAPAFVQKERLERAIRSLLTLSFAATVLALVIVSATRGIDRGDLFEIVVISIVWLTLIAAGPLLAVVFRRAVPRWSEQVPEPAQQATDSER